MADSDQVQEHGRTYHKGGKYVLPDIRDCCPIRPLADLLMQWCSGRDESPWAIESVAFKQNQLAHFNADKQHVLFTELKQGNLSLEPLDTISLKNIH